MQDGASCWSPASWVPQQLCGTSVKKRVLPTKPGLGAPRRGATTALAAREEVPLRDLTSRARNQRFLSKAHQILPSDTKFGGVGVTSSGVKFNK